MFLRSELDLKLFLIKPIMSFDSFILHMQLPLATKKDKEKNNITVYNRLCMICNVELVLTSSTL